MSAYSNTIIYFVSIVTTLIHLSHIRHLKFLKSLFWLSTICTYSSKSLNICPSLSSQYIIAGSLCIAAENKLNSPSTLICIYPSSLFPNISKVVYKSLTIIYHLQLLIINYFVIIIRDNVVFFSQTLFKGIRGVLLLFTLLQFIISICLSAFACKVSCCPPQVSDASSQGSEVKEA
uniref:Uncharacterized protein n=1 Tax=Cyprinus carpio TaxID=7962 RepID=A0A8C2CT25_CYPCA